MQHVASFPAMDLQHQITGCPRVNLKIKNNSDIFEQQVFCLCRRKKGEEGWRQYMTDVATNLEEFSIHLQKPPDLGLMFSSFIGIYYTL